MRRHVNLGTLQTLGLLSLMGCVTAPPPRVLGEAQSRLSSERAQRLEGSRPRLIEEARQYTQAALDAQERGEQETAEMNAQLAIQRFDTAEHLEAREVAETQQRAMIKAVEEISGDVDTAQRERDALAQFRDAEARFASIEAQLAQVRADDQSALAQAQRGLIAARQAQSEAVGGSAPRLAEAQYAQAVALLDNAVAALKAGLNEESLGLAQSAQAQFEQALAEAAEVGAGRSKSAASSAQAKAKAKAALDDALTARAAALAKRMKIRDPGRFEQAEALLQVAKARFKSGDYAAALSRAKDALAAYRGERAVSAASQAIAAAEEARAMALGRGAAGSPQVAQADSTLELARGALVAGDEPRAKKLAEQAKLFYMSAGGVGVPGQAASVQMAQGPLGSQGSIQDALARDHVERTLMQLRQERAYALAEGRQRTCPDAFNGFEAMLELAIDRLKANALTDAAELTGRASEHLRACGRTVLAPEGLKPGAMKSKSAKAGAKVSKAAKAKSAKAQAAAKREDRDERLARQAAEAAIGLGQRMFIKARLAKLGPAVLEEPQVLLAEAQRWYERGAWKQAELMAKEANALLRAARAPAPSTTEDAKAKSKKGAKAEAPKSRALPKKGAPQGEQAANCPGLVGRLSEARMAKSRASVSAQTPKQQGELMRILQMHSAVEGLVVDGKCHEADVFLRTVEEGFSALSAPDHGGMAQVAEQPAAGVIQAEASAAKSQAKPPVARCEAIRQQVGDLRVSQGLASAAIRTPKDREVFTRALNYLQRGLQSADEGQCQRADADLKDAQRGFDWLGAKLGQETPKAEAPKAAPAPVPTLLPGNEAWRASYQQVLDTLVVRDRAQIAGKSKAEKDRLVIANQFMDKSHAAWRAKDYQAAGRYAQAARVDYEAVLSMAQSREADAKLSAKKAASARSAAQKAADEQREAAQKAAAAKAAALKVSSAKTAAERAAAERAAAQKAAAAEAAAKQAAASAKAAEAAAKQAAAQKAAAAKAAQSRDAQDHATKAVHEAEVLLARCEGKGCAKADAALYAQASGELKTARAALKAGDHPLCETHAGGAKTALTTLLAKPLSFTLPASATRVTRRGDKLELSPRITFESGSDTLTTGSLISVNELAEVIKANQATIARVSLIGFTDSQGRATANKLLSQRRAQALMRALIDRGAPAALISAEGRGESEPIASNKTAAGRERNRRVEVHLVLR